MQPTHLSRTHKHMQRALALPPTPIPAMSVQARTPLSAAHCMQPPQTWPSQPLNTCANPATAWRPAALTLIKQGDTAYAACVPVSQLLLLRQQWKLRVAAQHCWHGLDAAAAVAVLEACREIHTRAGHQHRCRHSEGRGASIQGCAPRSNTCNLHRACRLAPSRRHARRQAGVAECTLHMQHSGLSSGRRALHMPVNFALGRQSCAACNCCRHAERTHTHAHAHTHTHTHTHTHLHKYPCLPPCTTRACQRSFPKNPTATHRQAIHKRLHPSLTVCRKFARKKVNWCHSRSNLPTPAEHNMPAPAAQSKARHCCAPCTHPAHTHVRVRTPCTQHVQVESPRPALSPYTCTPWACFFSACPCPCPCLPLRPHATHHHRAPARAGCACGRWQSAEGPWAWG